jgi:DNA-binding transcriptional MerR regulator
MLEVKVSEQLLTPKSAVALVGVILLLRDVGFSLAEQKALVAPRGVALDEWRRLARRKLPRTPTSVLKKSALSW